MQIFIISLLIFAFNEIGNSDNDITISAKNAELLGTWRSIEHEHDKFKPKHEIIIGRDSILISKTNMFDGYVQILTYKRSNDTIFATALEYMSFDFNVGVITSHYKFRFDSIILVLNNDTPMMKLILYPVQPGTIFHKVSGKSDINFDFEDQFKRSQLSGRFKSDYNRQGIPETKSRRNRQ